MNSLTVNSRTSAAASITIAGNATPGPRDVSLTTGTEVATLTGGFTVAGGAVLSIAKSHSGKFTPGQNGAVYSIVVSNATSAGPTSGTVTVTEIPPQGMSLASMSGGSTWSCSVPLAECTTSVVLNGGSSYPAIAVTVNVSGSASTPVTNQASVSGGGSATAYANDRTVIASPCDVNQDGSTDVSDVQEMINEALGAAPAVHDLSHDGTVKVVEVQLVIDAALGLGCSAAVN